jgi:hypothetical protein
MTNKTALRCTQTHFFNQLCQERQDIKNSAANTIIFYRQSYAEVAGGGPSHFGQAVGEGAA